MIKQHTYTMCATFNIDEITLKRLLEKYPDRGNKIRTNGDVFPSENAVIVTAESPTVCKWGFTRFDRNGLLINARAETVTQKQTFSSCFAHTRCVIPTNGFYEWDPSKHKHYFVRADGEPFFLCGFYRKESDGIRFVVLTKPATPPVSEYHNRIPVIAASERTEQYLTDIEFARNFITENAEFELTEYL